MAWKNADETVSQNPSAHRAQVGAIGPWMWQFGRGRVRRNQVGHSRTLRYCAV
jgi:hypothetical protein